MTTFGPTVFRTVVMLKEDLDKFVVNAQNLPSLAEAIVGMTVHLTGSQSGYITGHFYRCKETDGDRTWEDLTECGTGTKNLGNGLHVEREITVDDRVESTDGYLHIYWDKYPPHATSSSNPNPLVSSVVVRKLREYPVNPRDGEVLVVCDTTNRYTQLEPYMFFDKAPVDADYKYRVFHIHKSKWFCYQDCEEVKPKE